MTELVFATNNRNKLKEAEGILPDNFLLLNLDDIGCTAELPETADTLEENALMKARYVSEHFACNCFSDDTGLLVDALDGRPGVFSARYSGPEADSDKNIDKLLGEMEGKTMRKARFTTVIALILDGEEYLFEGSVEGTITEKRMGAKGFGYDPVFVPEGYSESFAQMSAEEKNRISHRGRALGKMQEFLMERSLRR